MLQRVMIATAILSRPRLLLADECTTALDVTTQAEVMAILDELRRERGLSMLFITHDLELAGAVCDRTCVMYAGQVVETRAANALHGDPLHPYSAALVEARPDITAAAERLVAIPGGRCRRSRRRPGAGSHRGARTRRDLAGARAGFHRAGRRAGALRARRRPARSAAGRCPCLSLRRRRGRC